MKHNVTIYDLLLSCPGDAYKECYSTVKEAIEKINADPQINNSAFISLKHWSTSSYPQSGGSPQKMLNSQIVNDADIAIAIFWTRFGSPTDEYKSGTEEEIDLLIKKQKQVFLYFLDKPIPPSITDSVDYMENRKKITLFQKKYEGLYCIVKDENELRGKIIDHLKLYFSKNNTNIKNDSKKWYRSDTGEEIFPTELLKYGNITAQIDGTVARAEILKPDGTVVYAEIDAEKGSASNIVAEGFPQEYVIDIPQNLLINKKDGTTMIQGITYKAEVYLLKFSGYALAIYDVKDNKLQDVQIKAPAGMTVLVDTTNKRICIVNKVDDITRPIH